MRLVLAVAALLVLAAAAEAKIVVRESIAGVKLGMTSAQVRAVLGKPHHVTYRPDQVEGGVKIFDYGLTDVILTRGAQAQVLRVKTTSRAQRTANGLGVGSMRAAIKRAYPSATCVDRICAIGDAAATTTFHLTTAGRTHTVSLSSFND